MFSLTPKWLKVLAYFDLWDASEKCARVRVSSATKPKVIKSANTFVLT